MRNENGQSLVEIIIALAIGAILVGFSTGIIVTILKSNLESGHVQTAANLGNELIDNVKLLSTNDWRAIYDLSKGSSNHYSITTSTTPFTATSTDETVAVDGITYTRYFYIENVSRDGSDDIVSVGGTDDPSTQKIVVKITWAGNAGIELVSFVTRSRNETFTQNNWSGGAGVEGPVTGSTSSFATSTNINVTDSGTIKVVEF